MTRKRRAIMSCLCLLLALTAALGCNLTHFDKQATFMETMKSQLASEDPVAADRAALVLLSSDTEPAYRILKAALAREGSATTRAAVIKAFTTEQDARIESEAVQALGDSDEGIVTLAKTYLSKVGRDGTAADLMPIARDASRAARERTAALAVIAQIGSAASVEGLIGLLEEANPEIVDAAGNALRDITYQRQFANDADIWRSWHRQNRSLTREQWQRVGSRFYTQVEELKSNISNLEEKSTSSERELVARYRQIVDLGIELQRYQMVIDVLAQAKPIEAQVYAAQALGKVKAAQGVKALIEKAASDDAGLAKACIDSLGAIQDPSATDVVASRLSSRDASVRLSAVTAYAALPQSDMERLLPLAGDASPEVRAAAARAFGARRWEKGVPSLLAGLEDKSTEVRVAAADALGAVGDKAAIGALVELTRDADDKVRFTAVRSLSALSNGASSDAFGAADAFLAATRDGVSGVREAAVIALAKTGDRRAVDRMYEMATSDSDRGVAEQAWTALVGVAGSDATLVLPLATKLEDSGRFTKAEALLKTLADSTGNGDDVMEARRRLAKGYLAAGNNQAARIYFQRVLDERPDDAEAVAGVTAALENMDDLGGLAAVYAREIASGRAGAEAKASFVDVLGKLLERPNYAAVVQAAQQALAGANGLDQQYAATVKDIESRALPGYLKTLVDALGDPQDGARRAAREALAGYGRVASQALVDGLESAGDGTRSVCLELLMALAEGKSFGFDAKKSAAEQQDALSQWRAWQAATTAQR